MMIPAAPQLRVLFYQEDGEWIAHLLEMDLIGTGSTVEDAQKELLQAFEAQLSFCIQHGTDPFFPAPPEIFAMWEQTQHEELASLIKAPEKARVHNRRSGIVTPPPQKDRNAHGWSVQTCAG